MAKRSTTENSTYLPEYSKLPPQAIDLEEAVLSAILIEKDACGKVSGFLKPTHFYKPAHRDIYQQMLWMDERHLPIDLLMVMEQLKKVRKLNQIGGAAYLAQLTSRVTSSANIEYHAVAIVEKAKARELIVMCNYYMREAYEDSADALELIEKASDEIINIAKDMARNDETDIYTAELEVFAQVEKFLDTPEAERVEPGCSWPFPSMSRRLGNYQEGDMVVVAARPGMGKTAFVLEVADDGEQNEVTLMFTYEMPKHQLAARTLYRRARVNTRKDRQKAKLDGHARAKLKKAIDNPAGNLVVVEAYGMTIAALRAKVRQIAEKCLDEGKVLKRIVIDYLQLVAPSDERKDENAQLTEISRGCKMMAIEFKATVFALSQLNRKVEDRNDKRPKASDVRGSGAIEQDADLILALFRPEFYKIFKDSKGRNLRNIVEVLILKNRHGESEYPVLLYLAAKWGAFFDSREDLEDEEERVNKAREVWEKANPKPTASDLAEELPF